MSIQSPSPDAPSVSSPVHIWVQEQLGCASGGADSNRGVDRGGTRSPYQHLGD